MFPFYWGLNRRRLSQMFQLLNLCFVELFLTQSSSETLRGRVASLVVKSDSRRTRSIEIGSDGVVQDCAAVHQPCARRNTIYAFSLNYSWHISLWGIEGSSGWSSSQVRQYKCMHTESIDFSGFCCGSSILRQKYIICVFLPHIYVCFSMYYSWQPICGVKEASGEKNFTHFLLAYVWSVGNCTIFLEGTTLSWRTIHDLAIATFWSVG